MKKIKLLLVAFLAGSLLVSCFKDQDDEIGFASTLDIQSFIYEGLNIFYLYKADQPDLANDRFGSTEARNNFLASFATPESLFEHLLVEEDRFSYLIDDYRILERSLDGVALRNGMEFGLVRIQSSGDIFGYVRYVLPNTSASENGVQRGMIFNTIDGVALTENNFNDLLAPASYSIGLATLNGDALTPTGESISLTKQQITENPVHISKVLTVGGQKTGYLMYNAFTADFDSQLNAVFSDFKAQGVTDLVLDLRYNGGGSIQTANNLASMITGQFNGQLFVELVYNENFPSQQRLFDQKIETTGETINSLNLNRVFVLTTSSTASASELVISGLLPYIEVVQIGETTTGKFQGSTVVYDSPEYTNKVHVNLDHHYAMLPLILKSVNAEGFTDYANGIEPDLLLQENFGSLGVLGEPNEPLLSAALNQIVPGLRPLEPSQQNAKAFKTIGESGMNSPIHQRMFVD